MTVTFYLEIVDGDKHTWVNHSVTKAEEIDWLLGEVKKTLDKAFVMKNNPKSGFLKSLFGGGGGVGGSNPGSLPSADSNTAPHLKPGFKNRMGDSDFREP